MYQTCRAIQFDLFIRSPLSRLETAAGKIQQDITGLLHHTPHGEPLAVALRAFHGTHLEQPGGLFAIESHVVHKRFTVEWIAAEDGAGGNRMGSDCVAGIDCKGDLISIEYSEDK